jgi:hypothetical protein
VGVMSDTKEVISVERFSDEIEAVIYFISKKAKNNSNLKGLATITSSIILDNDIIFDRVERIFTIKIPSEQVLRVYCPEVPKSEEEVRINLLNKFSGAIARAQLEAYERIRTMLRGILSEKQRKDFLDEYKNFVKEKSLEHKS